MSEELIPIISIDISVGVSTEKWGVGRDLVYKFISDIHNWDDTS